MTTPNSELRARLREAIDVLNNNRQRLVENAFKEWHGWYDERDIETVKSLLADLSRILTALRDEVARKEEALKSFEHGIFIERLSDGWNIKLCGEQNAHYEALYNHIAKFIVRSGRTNDPTDAG